MANICLTTWKVLGNKSQLDQLNTSIENAMTEEGSFLDVVTNLGGTEEDISDCRYGYISENSFDESGQILTISLESDWIEPTQFRQFILRQFNDITILYSSEEPECEYFETNDKDSKFFFHFKCFDGEDMEFRTLEEACEYYAGTTGEEVHTIEEINELLDDSGEWRPFMEAAVVED